MAYEPKPNTGSLWVNDRKETDKHPDRTGSALIDGKAYFVDGWINEKDGKKWLSLKFKLKNNQPGATHQPAPVGKAAPRDDSSDIPF